MYKNITNANNDTSSSSPVDSNSNSLHQRVHEFEKTANDMIRKLTDTLHAIEKSNNKPETVENLKLSIAPDAATLISQGVSLVLETHGYSSELSNAVMKIQSTLREKFREVQYNGYEAI